MPTRPAALRLPPVNPRHLRYLLTSPSLGIAYLAEMALSLESKGRLHEHAETQLLVVVRGHVVIEFPDSRIDLGPDTMLAVPPRRPHAAVAARGWPSVQLLDLRTAAAPGNPLDVHLRAMRDKPQRLPEGAAAAAADKLREAVGASGAAQRAQVLAAIWSLLAAGAPRRARGRAAAPPMDIRLQLCELLMRGHFARPLSPDDIARHVRLSRSQLTRLYRTHLRITPAARLRQVRLEAAEGMLRSSALSVKEIATRCGFGSTNSFIRAFHEAHGLSPGRYRRQR